MILEPRTQTWSPWWFATAVAAAGGVGAWFAWPWPLTTRRHRVGGVESFLPSVLFLAVAIGAALAACRARHPLARFINLFLLGLLVLMLSHFISSLAGR
jgi:hypothetical protein